MRGVACSCWKEGALRRACAVALKDGAMDMLLLAFVCPMRSVTNTPAEMREGVKPHLSVLCVVRRLHRVSSLKRKMSTVSLLNKTPTT